MNSIDIMILGIILFFGIKGFFRGIIIEVFTLGSLLIGYFAAVREMSIMAGVLKHYIHMPDLLSNVLGFVIIYTVVVIVLRWVGMGLKQFLRWSFLGWLDRGGGVLFGAFKGALIASLILLLESVLPVGDSLKKEQEESRFFEPVRAVAPWVFNTFKVIAPGAKDFYEEIKEGLEDKSKKIIDDMINKKIGSIEQEVKKRVGSE